MTIDEMKNKISMELCGTDAQLGFEVICKKLAELEKVNAELKQKLESDELALNEASEIIAELKAHCKAVDEVNEKMKCCGNCKHIEFRYFVENMQIKNITNYCSDCIRFIKINKKDKWELAE